MRYCKILLRFACFVTLVCVLSACLFAVPIIQGFKEVGLTEADRATLLTQELKHFHHAVQDGNRMRALQYADEQFRDEFKNLLRQYSRHEKVVDTEIDFVDLADEANTAEVEIFLKYYKQPYYVVKERLIKELWKFTVSSGWKLHAFDIEDEDVESS